MNSIKYIFILVASLIFFSCQEEYTNTEVDGKAGIIAIEGFVTNDSASYTVRISKSNSFESSSHSVNPYRKAVVWIIGPHNKQYLLQEFEPGKYSSQIGQFVGVVGYKYMLKVILTDGVVIESDLCEILPPPNSRYISRRIKHQIGID